VFDLLFFGANIFIIRLKWMKCRNLCPGLQNMFSMNLSLKHTRKTNKRSVIKRVIFRAFKTGLFWNSACRAGRVLRGDADMSLWDSHDFFCKFNFNNSYCERYFWTFGSILFLRFYSRDNVYSSHTQHFLINVFSMSWKLYSLPTNFTNQNTKVEANKVVER